MIQVFSEEWFEIHQKKLVWFANTKWGRHFFGINRIPLNKKISAITPSSYRWDNDTTVDGRESFRINHLTHDKYAKRLRSGFKPFWYLLHFIDWLFNFNPIPQLRLNFGFDTFFQYPNEGRTQEIDISVYSGGLGEVHDFDDLKNIENKGSGYNYNASYIDLAYLRASSTTNKYEEMGRGLLGFKVLDLSGYTLESGSLTLSGQSKTNGLGSLGISFVISDPINPLYVTVDDFQSFSDIRIGDDISYSSFNSSGDNVVTLNQTALDYIAERALNYAYTANVYIGTLFTIDLDDSGSPTWATFPAETYLRCYSTENTTSSTGNDPELSIKYVGEKDLSETISLSDTTSTKRIYDTDEQLSLSDSTSLIKVLNLSESIGIADNLGTFNFKLILSENISIADTFSRGGTTYYRTLTDTIGIDGDILGTPSQLRKKTGISPVWILKMPFATETIYLSDRIFTCDSLDGGITTKGWVKDWSNISEDISGEIGKTKISDLSIQVIIDYDATNTIHELLWDLSEDVESLTCELYVWVTELAGLGTPPELIWTGNINHYAQNDDLVYSIQLIDKSVFLDKKIGNLADTTEFAQLDPDDIGKMVPIVYGNVQQVPALAIDAGAISTIAEDLTSSETSIDISDASQFTSSGTIQIESEKITYTGKSDNTLTGCTRGVSGTTATTHDRGMQVGLVQSEYWYLVADHPVKSIDAVYVDGVRQTGGDFTVYTDHSGKAKIKFTALPILQKSVDIEVDDNINVQDYAISEVAHDHNVNTNTTRAQVPTTTLPYIWSFSSVPANTWQYANIYFSSPGGTIIDQQVTVTISSIIGNAIQINGQTRYSTGTYSYTTTSRQNYIRVGVKHTLTGSSQTISIGISACNRSVYFNQDASESTLKTNVSKVFAQKAKISGGKDYYVGLTGNSSADTVIGTQITADVQGYKDDGSGTFTGTANALIERPDHVFKHFLYTYADLATSDFYSNAGNYFTSKSYAFAGILNKKKYIRTWLNEWAWQCRCYFKFSAGQAQLLWRPDSIVSTKSITESMIRRQGAKTMIKGPQPSPLTDIINIFDVQYDRDWTISDSEDGSYKEILKEPTTPASDPSVIRYGEKSKSELFRFDFVTSSTMAQDLLTFYRNRYKDRKKIFQVELFLDNFDLTFGQGVTLVPRDNVVCEIQMVNIYPGNGSNNRIDKVVLKLKEY